MNSETVGLDETLPRATDSPDGEASSRADDDAGRDVSNERARPIERFAVAAGKSTRETTRTVTL